MARLRSKVSLFYPILLLSVSLLSNGLNGLSVTMADAAPIVNGIVDDDASGIGDSAADVAAGLEEEEAHQAVTSAGTHANAHKKADAGGELSAEDIFHEIDSNHDASITLDEFTSNFSTLKSKIGNSKGTRAKFSTFIANAGAGGGADDSGPGGFANAFTSSTMMIIATEIGDKTFFIAAVLSMRNSRFVVFSGAILALSCMTILSTMMGLILPSFLPRQYTHIIGGILFLYFGVKLMYDSRSMSNKVSDELEEVEEELLHSSDKKDDTDIENNTSLMEESDSPKKNVAHKQDNNTPRKIFFQSFLLTFLAEWGDRSQIATIALAAAKDPIGVTVGGCLGHSLCTGMAVIGGRILASKISEKSVSFWGGSIFLGFAVHSLFFES